MFPEQSQPVMWLSSGMDIGLQFITQIFSRIQVRVLHRPVNNAHVGLLEGALHRTFWVVAMLKVAKAL